jgi:hypothetical protein
LTTRTRAARALAAIAATGLAATGAQAAGTTAKAGPKPARGKSCASPWVVTYARGAVTGDTREVSLRVSIKGSRISVTWHAQRGYQFCSVVLTEARGQVFRSTNPSATYAYTDATPNHSNGIRTLRATARNPR